MYMCNHAGIDRNEEQMQIIAPDATVFSASLHILDIADEQDMTVLQYDCSRLHVRLSG